MNQFLVMFLVPVAVLDEWMRVKPVERKAEEMKMRDAWNAWTEAHAGMIKETKGAGKTKLVTSEGVSDTRNGMMLYSVVEGESHEAVAKMFEGHPHLSIPQASIEVMAIRPM